MRIEKSPEKSFLIGGQWYRDIRYTPKDFEAWQILLAQTFKKNPALCFWLLELRQAGTVLKSTGELDFSNSFCAMDAEKIKQELQKFEFLIPLLKKVAQSVKYDPKPKPKAKIISVDLPTEIKPNKIDKSETKIEPPTDKIPKVKFSDNPNLRHKQIFQFAYWLKNKGKTQIETVEILVKNNIANFAAEEFADDVFRLPGERKISVNGVTKYRTAKFYRKNFNYSRS